MIEIVLGPPGTGKTTTLLGLVEEELSRGVPPDRIGYVTFTRRGAEEAIERACKKFNFRPEQLPHFRTLHSLCYRQLGLRSGDVLTGKAFAEFSEYADIRVTGRAWSDDGMLTGFEEGDRILFMENLARIRQIPLRQQYDLANDGLNWNEVSRVATALETFKRDRELLDYTDMLHQFVANDRDVGLHRLFVDEAQDLSSLQWSVVDLLARSAERVVVAGDDDQAIYGWAGADVEHLIRMQGDARVLGQSYRVPPAIQRISSGVIGGVRNRRAKQWAAKRGGKGTVEYLPSFDSADTSGAGSVLILVRNVYVMREQVEPAMRAAGVVYERNGKSSIDPAMLQAAVSWEALRKGDPVTLAEARRMYEFMRSLKSIRRGHKTLPTFGEDEDAAVTMRDLVDHGGLLVQPTKIWHEALDKLPPADMSYMVAARQRGEKLRGGKPRVRLSTIHSAKGGEADHVVLMKEMASRTHREMHDNPEDERRVWYVGVTRAREKLSIVSSQTSRECPWI